MEELSDVEFKAWCLQITDPPPLERTDPELAEHLRLVANGTHPAVKSISGDWRGHTYVLHNGRVAEFKKKLPGRNEPCPCGSGKKFKKCHG